jgi:glutathione S-transferase
LNNRFVDLQNKPEWFLKLSPLGKVPVLQVGDKVIFESSVILEYIDESYGPTLLPKTPLERADTRAWIVFANELQNAYVTLWKSKDPADIEPTIEKGDKLLAILEARLQGENPFFYGNVS